MLRPASDTSLTTPRQAMGLSVRDIIFVLFRRRWVVLAVALPIIVLGGSSLFQQTGSFTASARLVVELTKVDNPRWNVNGRNVDFDRELSTLSNIAMSLPVAVKAAVTLRDSIPVMVDLDPNLEPLPRHNNLRDFLLEGLDVSVVGESNILEFRFASIHPRISLMCVGAMRDAFVEYQTYGRKNSAAVEYYEEQIDMVKAEMDSLLFVRGEVLKANGYSSLKDELRFESGHLADLQNELSQATVTRKTLEREYNRLVQYLEGDPRDFPMGPDENRVHTLVYWRNTVSKHDDEYNSLLKLHTESSNAAKRHREMIANGLKNLAAEQRSYVRSLELNLDTAREKESALAGQVAEVQERNRKGPRVYQQVSLLDSEINTLRNLLEDLQGKRGEVRLDQNADSRISKVVVLTDPELASVLSGSKTIVYFIVIVVFALALGLVGAFTREHLDHRVYSPRDVEDHLKLPVFASVTKVD
jgi:uncharacterized protein involved in exopolysaccharide biosynthesis